MDDLIFHAGERLVQERTGERATALINSRTILPHVPAAARTFVAGQRWCVMGAATAAGRVCACVVTGIPGFVQCSGDLESVALTLEDPQGLVTVTAPLDGMRVGQSMALLFIELQTRRRLRVNGKVKSIASGRLEVAVVQAFAVCPRYIQKRAPVDDAEGHPLLAAPFAGILLDSIAEDWISKADTFFIASMGPSGDTDVSHRGGNQGFVQVLGQTLRIPDFNGNGMFNTLGNLAVEPRCGLVFPDFNGSRQLQLVGQARACFDVAQGMESTGGTGRWIEFVVETWRVTPFNQPQRWEFVELSRFNP